jgi:hypothetical protein
MPGFLPLGESILPAGLDLGVTDHGTPGGRRTIPREGTAGYFGSQLPDPRPLLAAAQEHAVNDPPPVQAAALHSAALERDLPFERVLANPAEASPKASVPFDFQRAAEVPPMVAVLTDPTKRVFTAGEEEKYLKLYRDLNPWMPTGPGARALNMALGGKEAFQRANLYFEMGVAGGALSPEKQRRLDALDTASSMRPTPDGFVDEVLGMAPLIVAGGAAGISGGIAAGLTMGPEAAPVGAFLGATAVNAPQMIGANFEQYLKSGVPKEAAWPAALLAGSTGAVIDTVTMGFLTHIPALSILSKIPIFKDLDSKAASAAMSMALKDSSFLRAFTGAVKSGAAGAAGMDLMEATTLLGHYAAVAAGGAGTAPTADEAVGRLIHAAEFGGLVGVGMGAPGLLLRETLGKVHEGKTAETILQRIYATTDGLKAVETDPGKGVVKGYADAISKEGTVKTFSVPVEALDKLFQANDLTPEMVEARMPEVAAKIREARDLGTRVDLSPGDFLAHVRPLDKTMTLMQDIGLNDGMSPSEAKALGPKLAEARKQVVERKTREEGMTPEEHVASHIEKELLGADFTREGARLQSSLVAAAVQRIAERTGKSATDIYRESPLSVERDASLKISMGEKPDQPAGQVSLDQSDPKGVQRAKVVIDNAIASRYTHPEAPLKLDVLTKRASTVGLGDGDFLVQVVSQLGLQKGPDNADVYKQIAGQGYSTALYLRALMDAKAAGRGFASDATRSDATEIMYPRLQRLGVPFDLVKVSPDNTFFNNRFFLDSAKLGKVDLDAAWEKLVSEAKGKKGDFSGLSDAEVSKVVAGLTELRQTSGDKIRGFINYDPKTRDWFKVTLTGNATLTTFVHESAHYLLEVMRKYEGASPEIAGELRTLEKWAGVEAGGEWTVPALEKFARGFETYLGEGKAPSAKLASAFATMKAWVLHVYRTLTKLNAPLTDEVRGVMDRMLANDSEVTARKADLGFGGTMAALDGMSPEATATYRAAWDKADRSVREKMDREAINAAKLEKGAEYKRIKSEAATEVTSMPVYRARAYLEGRGLPEGLMPPAEFRTFDAAEVRGKMGRSLGDLKNMISETGGASPDEMAPYFGFRNGTEMLTALRDSPAESTAISRMTKVEMTKRFPEYGPDPAWLEKSVLSKLHNDDAVSHALELNLRVTHTKANLPPPVRPIEVARAAAVGRALESVYADLNPRKYIKAEEDAVKAETQAYAAKDFPAAVEAARRRIFNRAMWSEAMKARDSMDSTETLAKRFATTDAMAKLGKGDPAIRDAVRSLVTGLGFQKQSAERLQPMSVYVDMIREAGYPVSIDPVLLEYAVRPWDEVTYLESTAVRDALKNLSHLAAEMRQVKIGEESVRLDTLAETLRSNLEKSGYLNRRGDSGADPTKIQEWRAEVTKPATILVDLDGGKPGELTKAWMGDAEKGQYEKERRQRMRIDDMRALDKEHVPEGWRKIANTKFMWVDGHEYTGAQLFAVILNLGSKSNMDKLFRGYEKAGRPGWEQAAVIARLHEIFPETGPKSVWAWAQAKLDYISRPDMWEDSSAVRERLAGVRPEKTHATPIPTPDGGTIEGGYYPLVYDHRIPLTDKERSVQYGSQEALDAMQEANPLNLYAANGFTKGRTGYAAPILLDPAALAGHFYEVDHFISNAEGIVARHKIINDPTIKKLIVDSVGIEAWQQLKASNNFIAADGRILTRERSASLSTINNLIYHNSLLTMGGNFLSGINQVVQGVPATLALLGPKSMPYFARALVDFAREPFSMWERLNAESGELRGTEMHMDRDVRVVLSREATGESVDVVKARAASFLMAPVVFGQKVVNVLTYETAKQMALAEGKSPADAVFLGNHYVRQSQSTASPFDLTGVQRNKDMLLRVFTALASYTFSLNDIIMPRRLSQKEVAESLGRFTMIMATGIVTRALFNAALPAVAEKDRAGAKGLEGWAAGKGGEGARLTMQMMLEQMSNVPLVGRTAASIVSGREPRFSSIPDTITRTSKTIFDAVSEGKEPNKAKAKAVVDMIGLLSGVPTRHTVFAPGEFFYELGRGNIDTSPYNFFQQMALVRPGQKGEK